MEIFGIGTDIIEVERIRDAVKNNPGFLERIYTKDEVFYCEERKGKMYESLASRFAAKEAVAKSLYQGLGKVMFFKEIEVLNSVEGSPYVALHGNANFYFLMNGLKEIKISLSATKNYASAYAVSFK